MLRAKPEVFAPTDGVLYVTCDTSRRGERGADFSDPLLVNTVFPLAFRRMRISTRDVELAGATGSEVTAKVEVRAAIALTPDTDVTLNGKLFELTRVESRGRTCWLWLSEIACDGTVELLPDSVTRDSHGIPVEGSDLPITVWCRRVSPFARRVNATGIDEIRPALRLRLRSSDYAGESRLKRLGATYSVTSVDNVGRWVDLTCSQKVADR